MERFRHIKGGVIINKEVVIRGKLKINAHKQNTLQITSDRETIFSIATARKSSIEAKNFCCSCGERVSRDKIQTCSYCGSQVCTDCQDRQLIVE